jgi:hypothetical protein
MCGLCGYGHDREEEPGSHVTLRAITADQVYPYMDCLFSQIAEPPPPANPPRPASPPPAKPVSLLDELKDMGWLADE